jgi:hypothetical protein
MNGPLTVSNIKNFLFNFEKNKSHLIHDSTLRAEFKDEKDLDEGGNEKTETDIDL